MHFLRQDIRRKYASYIKGVLNTFSEKKSSHFMRHAFSLELCLLPSQEKRVLLCSMRGHNEMVL